MNCHPPTVLIVLLVGVGSLGVGQQADQPTPTPESAGLIVFASDRDGDFELYRVKPDGGELTKLTDNEFSDTAASWSPDGTKIAFVSDREGDQKVYTMKADGTAIVKVTDGVSDINRITWSRDGQQIAFDAKAGRRIDTWVCGIDGGGLKKIAEDAMWPDWSPDGKTIVFNRGQMPQLCVMDADGGNARMLLKDPGDMLPDLAPAWSADGKRVLYTAVTGVAQDEAGERAMTYEVRSVAVSGDDVRLITKLNGMALSWSPDAKKALLMKINGEESNLHIVTIGTDEDVPLATDKGKVTSADWTGGQ